MKELDLGLIDELIQNIISTRNKINTLDEYLELYKTQLSDAMKGASYVATEHGSVTLIAYDVQRIDKDKAQEVCNETLENPRPVEFDELTKVSDVSFYLVKPPKEAE